MHVHQELRREGGVLNKFCKTPPFRRSSWCICSIENLPASPPTGLGGGMGFTRSKSIAILTPKDKKQVKTLLGVAEGMTSLKHRK